MTGQQKRAAVTRQIHPALALLLLVASGLVFIVGVQLFVLSEQTDTYFAWTINPPLTAAFLGGAYWSACLMELLAARQRVWANARIAAPAVFLFTTITLAVSLYHIDRFHLNDPRPLTRALTYIWFAVYALVPLLFAALLVAQARQLGVDPPRTRPLPGWARAVLALQALLLAGPGVVLLLTPGLALDYWPWQLTPLTARAIGAWLVALGMAAAHAADENDWGRLRIATTAYIAFGALELVALARYAGSVRWDRPATYVLIGVLVSALVSGIYGWRRAGEH